MPRIRGIGVLHWTTASGASGAVRAPPDPATGREHEHREDTVVQPTRGESANGDVSAPDAVGRGVLGHDADAPAYLFVLAGHSLGSTPVGGGGTPRWFDLRRLLNLDAVGEPTESRIPVEATFDGEPALLALWPEPFCDQVVDRLRELLDSGQMLPEGSGPDPAPPAAASTFGVSTTGEQATPAQEREPQSTSGGSTAGADAFATRPADPTPEPDATRSEGDDVPVGGNDSDAPLWAAMDDRPLPGDGPRLAGGVEGEPRGELTLEDVVYHGGYPGHTKRRKKCVAVLDSRGLAVSGPNGPDFSLPWDTVLSVEAQNTDEAKFRLGVKAKRNSTVVVFECEQGVSIVLEAHDVPTMPLKGALHELLDEGPVAVA